MPEVKCEKPKPIAVEEPREVHYPKIEGKLRLGEKAITVAQAKEMLGWEEATDDNYLLTDQEDHKIRCVRNSHNRPFTKAWALEIAQAILHSGPGIPEEERHWRFNGENVIISKYASVNSGAHRLIGLVLAAQMWAGDIPFEGTAKADWKKFWPTEPTLETSIIFGASEDPRVLCTLDNTRPRTASDVLYTSGHFANVPPKDRQRLSRMLASAVKLLWDRTGMFKDAYAPYRSNAETYNFVARHLRLVDAVKHIAEEDGDGNISACLSPGYAAGLMYLMAATKTDLNGYKAVPIGDRSERHLDLSAWDKAEEFFVLLASKVTDFSAVRNVRRPISGKRSNLVYANTLNQGVGSVAERVAVLVLAWSCFSKDRPITLEDLMLEYTKTYNDDDTLASAVLKSDPTVGGIDLGEQREPDEEEEKDDPKEIEARKKAERKRQVAELMKRRAERTPKPPSVTAAGPGSPGSLPPTPKLKAGLKEVLRRQSSKDVQAEQTRKAREADEELAAAGSKKAAAALAVSKKMSDKKATRTRRA